MIFMFKHCFNCTVLELESFTRLLCPKNKHTSLMKSFTSLNFALAASMASISLTFASFLKTQNR